MHTTKRAVLLSCSDHYNHRLYVIDGYLRSLGYETVYYTCLLYTSDAADD